eukprot:SM000377S13799  [mRNA]  locus=s377:32580:36264:+ [translate_table: standard]
MPTYSPDGLLAGLRKPVKEIPCSFLYDKKGSELYERITELEEYYPFRAEEGLLKRHASDVVKSIAPGSIIVELGCGTARKTALLLNALIKRDGMCHFAGIDVSASFLEEAKLNLMKAVPGLTADSITLVQADYMEGLRKVRALFPMDTLCILWLGSSVGNLAANEAIEFFKDAHAAGGSNMQVLLCADMWKSKAILRAAYHDKKGVTEAFIKNGTRNALKCFVPGLTVDDESKWQYEVEVNEDLHMVEMYVRFLDGLDLCSSGGISIGAGERILVEVSRKFSVADLQGLASKSRFVIDAAWRTKQYGMQLEARLLTTTDSLQMLLPVERALQSCWDDTDNCFATLDWDEKPIDVRHPFCFYYGHVNAFAKLKILPDHPVSVDDHMFSRGIDPSLLEPGKCHSHPEVPKQWPAKSKIIAYVQRNRSLILEAVLKQKASMFSINLALEHERMHLETLAYMQAQAQKLLFQSSHLHNGLLGKKQPDLKLKAWPWMVPSLLIPAGKVVLGIDRKAGGFFWDNEGPPRLQSVAYPFLVSPLPVTVAQFRKFVVDDKGYSQARWWNADDFSFLQKQGVQCPGTWSLVAGECYVHSPQGTRHWSEVANAPAFVSLSEAMAFCTSKGCRVMTEPEWHRIVDSDAGERVEALRCGGWEWTYSLFDSYPGFEAMPEYPEYSTDFFDGQHYVLKGSSPATHPSLHRDSFRNYFQKQYPYVFAKFRCCKNA